MQQIDLTYEFTLSADRVYDYLSEHENLGPLFGAAVTRVRDGDTSRNGVGSVRRLRVAPLPSFLETVTAAVPHERLEYRISQGSPLTGHRAVLTFTPTPTGSRLRYVIEFSSVVPGLDRLVKLGLQRSLRRGLASVDTHG